MALHRCGEDLPARLVVKPESANPGGSVKNRVALAMIEEARAAGVLRPGDPPVEPTSGNTGIGLAMVAAAEGYPVTFTLPESMSRERRALLRAYGAELVLAPAAEGMRGPSPAPPNWPHGTAGSCRSSSPTRPTPTCTAVPPPRRSGRTPRDRSTSW
ncbi:pyridoxal-phosphate dependent enzyme [Streptomyces sp. NPDC057236]|uniref:pyridoxal-phosphate dependent enzyme n=1 Tax=Streptomyces sp. NPDC057236 TaxID=3346059 RepID=UPI00362F0A5B